MVVHRRLEHRLRGTDLALPRPVTRNRLSFSQTSLRGRSEKSSSARSRLRRPKETGRFNRRTNGSKSRPPIKPTRSGSSANSSFAAPARPANPPAMTRPAALADLIPGGLGHRVMPRSPRSYWRRECQSIPIERSSIFDLPRPKPTVRQIALHQALHFDAPAAINRCGIFRDAANAKRKPPQWQTSDTR
jgi:hypothetical protein